MELKLFKKKGYRVIMPTGYDMGRQTSKVIGYFKDYNAASDAAGDSGEIEDYDVFVDVNDNVYYVQNLEQKML